MKIGVDNFVMADMIMFAIVLIFQITSIIKNKYFYIIVLIVLHDSCIYVINTRLVSPVIIIQKRIE